MEKQNICPHGDDTYGLSLLLPPAACFLQGSSFESRGTNKDNCWRKANASSNSNDKYMNPLMKRETAAAGK